MNQINLNQYKFFYEIANCRSFSEASEKLHISQPAISKCIKQLENSLQVKLFERSNNGIQLTSNGKKLMTYVDIAYNAILTGQKKITESTDLSYGKIVIGVQSHIASFYLLKYIERFRKEYKGICFEIISLPTSELMKKLQEHRVDFIIDNTPIETIYNNLAIEHLTTFDNCLICSKEVYLEVNDVSNLDRATFILPRNRSSARRLMEKHFQEAYNFNLPIVLEVDTTDLIISSVKRNIGIGYVVRETVKNELLKNELKEIKLRYELPKLSIKLIYIKDYITYVPQMFIENYLKKGEDYEQNIQPYQGESICII